jgi:hypothetical protein
MVGEGTDQGLMARLASGEYVIDAHAVAEAMLNRLVRGELPRSAMLVTGEASNGHAVEAREERASSTGRGLS